MNLQTDIGEANIGDLRQIKSKNSFQECLKKLPKILVVDDEKFNCDIFYSFLMLLGCKDRKEVCEFAYSGVEAVEAV